jgi:predicted enzyme related to lactoylglutathione lyase
MAGQFCWIELLTSDIEASQAFYGAVMGWTCVAAGHNAHDYRLFSKDGQVAAGLMQLPEEAKARGARPSWFGYISSDDVNMDVADIDDAGGTVYRDPETIPDMGRFAVVSDPQGAAFGLWQDLSGRKGPDIPAMSTGHCGWRELMADDVEEAFAFYEEKFGWTRAEAHDMGPMGKYQLFATGGMPVGGMMKRPGNVPQSHWNYYLTVEAIDAAIAKVGAAGGKIVNGPNEVPGGAWIAHGVDPQGVFFAMVAAKR